MPRGKQTNRSPAPRRSQQNTSINNEAKNLGLLGVAVVLLITVFWPGGLGVIGPFVRSILLGLFGFGGLALPVVLAAVAILGLIAKEFRLPLIRTLILSWLVLALLHIIFNGVPPSYTSAFTNITDAYREGTMAGGGFFGAILGNFTRFIFGRFGATVVLVIAVVILAVLVSGRSFVSFVGSGASKAHVAYTKRKELLREQQERVQNATPQRKQPQTVRPAMRARPGDAFIDIDIKPIGRSTSDDFGDDFDDAYVEHGDDMYKDIDDYVDEDTLGESVEHNAPPARDIVIKMPEAAYDHDLAYTPPVEEVDTEWDFDIDFEDDDAEETAIDERITKNDTLEQNAEESPSLVVRGMFDDAPPPPQEAAEPPVSETLLYADFELPSLDLLARNEKPAYSAESRTQVMKNSRILEETLRSFRVEAEVVEVSVGPTVTRYDLAPGPGVKVNSIANLSNDLALSLAAQGIRIEAPIPGKAAVGIEIPNKEPQGVFLREILESERFAGFNSKLAFAVGKDIAGNPVVADVADMPHLLIAGATGAGKSVCINTLIASILYKASPSEVKLLMIDPKVVELSVYNGIPHLLIPVVTDPKKASGALNWGVQEMESRYNSFAQTMCRDLKSYNRYLEENGEQTLPQIVIIIDELADLMMTCKGEVEEAICRLAQKARAAGIHLIVATQRPSVDVITGLIKANIPSRLAFAVSSGTDSRTVLDMQGAEKLLGRGDMLFLPRGQNKPVRVQGGFISDKEVEQLVSFLKAQAPKEVSTEMIQQITMPGKSKIEGETDEFFHDAVDFLLTKGKASVSMLQRQFRIGYNRASRLMDDLEQRGIVGPEDGVKPRKVTITREEYGEIYGNEKN